jgi:hypothetical protein
MRPRARGDEPTHFWRGLVNVATDPICVAKNCQNENQQSNSRLILNGVNLPVMLVEHKLILMADFANPWPILSPNLFLPGTARSRAESCDTEWAIHRQLS